MPTFKSYLTGYLLSLVLTLGAYFIVTNKISHALFLIICFAVVQFVVQIIYFLHIGHGPDRTSNLVSFGLAFGAMFIVIAGSLWIMNNLNYNMTPMDMQNYITEDEGVYR